MSFSILIPIIIFMFIIHLIDIEIQKQLNDMKKLQFHLMLLQLRWKKILKRNINKLLKKI